MSISSAFFVPFPKMTGIYGLTRREEAELKRLSALSHSPSVPPSVAPAVAARPANNAEERFRRNVRPPPKVKVSGGVEIGRAHV